MPNLRAAIQDFATSNKIYVNATVTFYTADENGQKTSTLATLYRDTIGDTKLPNPQTLDSNGKFRVPVYIEDAVIAVVSGLGNTPAHETGVIPGGDWFAQAENAAAEAIAAKEDAEDAAVSALDSKNLAEDWARKTDGLVEATDYSAKAWSVGGTGVTDGDGAAKEWATKTGGTVDGSDYSAKHYANNADASAFAAGVSETNAGNSAAAALISANNAAASETAAGISETNAGNSAAAALVSENNAAASEISAADSAAKLVAASASSVLIGGGSKSFTTQAGKFFTPGSFLMVTSDAAPSTNYMFGQVTSYAGTALQMNVLAFGGAGTYDDWTITISGARGPSGAGAEADNVSYDNSTSGLSAVNVQDAIDEIDSDLGNLAGSLGTMAGQNANSVNITGGSVTGIADIAIADGGTGASTAAGARTNLGLVGSGSTDNTLPRFDGTAGALQTSGVTVDDSNGISGYYGAFNDQTGTTYTLQASDAGKVVTCTNASAITVTCPNSLGVGFNCTVIQGGAGQVTFSAASGAAIHNRQSQTKIAGQYGAVGLIVKTNSGGSSAVYNLSGDTSA